jgi:hypothetical protein
MSLLPGQKYACLLGYIKKTFAIIQTENLLLRIALINFYSRDHQNDRKITIIIFRIKGTDEAMMDDLELRYATALVNIIGYRYMC